MATITDGDIRQNKDKSKSPKNKYFLVHNVPIKIRDEDKEKNKRRNNIRK